MNTTQSPRRLTAPEMKTSISSSNWSLKLPRNCPTWQSPSESSFFHGMDYVKTERPWEWVGLLLCWSLTNRSALGNTKPPLTRGTSRALDCLPTRLCYLTSPLYEQRGSLTYGQGDIISNREIFQRFTQWRESPVLFPPLPFPSPLPFQEKERHLLCPKITCRIGVVAYLHSEFLHTCLAIGLLRSYIIFSSWGRLQRYLGVIKNNSWV